ncbi:MAG TPA: DUF2610 domain-containing protein [Thermoleophilaceae bacterium]|jgi:hypothetical protein
MESFVIPVQVPGGGSVPFTVWIGEAVPGVHPLEQQADWLRRERGLVFPKEVLDSFEQLARIALENNVSFVELVRYAMSEAEQQPGQEQQEGQEQPPGQEQQEGDEQPDASAGGADA